MDHPADTRHADITNDSHRSGFLKSFKDHPASVGETYFGHLVFAMRFAARLFIAASAALIHALIPAWFETTASRQVRAICDELENRHSHH